MKNKFILNFKILALVADVSTLEKAFLSLTN